MQLAQAAAGNSSGAGTPGAMRVEAPATGPAAEIGVAANAAPRRDRVAFDGNGGALAGGVASGRSVATKVPLPMRARI